MSRLFLDLEFVYLMMIHEYFWEMIFKSIEFNFLDRLFKEKNYSIIVKSVTVSLQCGQPNLSSHFLKMFEHPNIDEELSR